MLKWKTYNFARCCLLVLIGILPGCDEASFPSSVEEFEDPNSDQSLTALEDITNYTQLFGSVSPLERLTVVAPYESDSIQIDYRNADTDFQYSQIAIKNDEGLYAFLIPPISETTNELVEVSSGGLVFGDVSISPIPPSDPSYIPGEFSLGAMNSILMGLRNSISDFSDTLLSADSLTQEELISRQNIVKALQSSVAEFQTLIALVDDSVVFNNPIFDELTGELILNPSSLKIVDAIYLELLNNFVQNSLFLDAPDGQQLSDNFTSRPNFLQINNAAKARLATQDGLNALASLSVHSNHATESSQFEEFKNALAIVSASMVPAIVSNYVTEFEFPGSEAFLIDASSFLNNIEAGNDTGNNYIYSTALKSLENLTIEVTNK